ncbi:hypothetical protein H9I45_11145 [Polaribacter haliotis]|uniref:Uncharacterized protein n=1 Tax=Polaribacter haliotis TaxID=1888915 RepID=A0A7L8AD34_9FLAO|nr:hypothetical protein [Polaribacter haliotis]QOD59902.1 hypothetical protein H9I45_11145 [Polaribacter haliotis]
MELTKNQIQFIDHRLENEGVKYWDIRIEMLDHVVTDVEKRIELGEGFKDAVNNSFIFSGWNGSFDSLTKQRLFSINKIVRKQYFLKVKDLFIKPTSLLLIFLFVSIYYMVYSFASLSVFKTVTLIVLFAPITLGVILHLSEFSKTGKSGYLTYSTFYIFFSFLFLNAVIQFVKPEGIIPVSKEAHLFVWFSVSALNAILSFAGILVHLETSKKIKNIELKLKSL